MAVFIIVAAEKNKIYWKTKEHQHFPDYCQSLKLTKRKKVVPFYLSMVCCLSAIHIRVSVSVLPLLFVCFSVVPVIVFFHNQTN